jgi:hypothetical protein
VVQLFKKKVRKDNPTPAYSPARLGTLKIPQMQVCATALKARLLLIIVYGMLRAGRKGPAQQKRDQAPDKTPGLIISY